MKVLKIFIPLIFIFSILIVDYYNKYHKENTNFDQENIFLYVIKEDSIAFADSISKYIKITKYNKYIHTCICVCFQQTKYKASVLFRIFVS